MRGCQPAHRAQSSSNPRQACLEEGGAAGQRLGALGAQRAIHIHLHLRGGVRAWSKGFSTRWEHANARQLRYSRTGCMGRRSCGTTGQRRPRALTSATRSSKVLNLKRFCLLGLGCRSSSSSELILPLSTAGQTAPAAQRGKVGTGWRRRRRRRRSGRAGRGGAGWRKRLRCTISACKCCRWAGESAQAGRARAGWLLRAPAACQAYSHHCRCNADMLTDIHGAAKRWPARPICRCSRVRLPACRNVQCSAMIVGSSPPGPCMLLVATNAS